MHSHFHHVPNKSHSYPKKDVHSFRSQISIKDLDSFRSHISKKSCVFFRSKIFKKACFLYDPKYPKKTCSLYNTTCPKKRAFFSIPNSQTSAWFTIPSVQERRVLFTTPYFQKSRFLLDPICTKHVQKSVISLRF